MGIGQIAVIGAGRIGRIHAANARASRELSLKYVVDPIAEAAASLAEQSGARVATFDEVLADGEIDGVVIASSTDTHLNYSLRALEAGRAVFCEKPVHSDLAEAKAARKRLAASGGAFLLGFNRRFDPSFQKLKHALDQGRLGTVECVHIISHDPAPPPIDYIKVSGGLFKDMAIHDFDVARWLLGEEPVEVFASGSCLIDKGIAAAGDIDTARTVLRTASGRMCVISNSRRSGYGYDQRLEVFCSRGAIRADNVAQSTVSTWTDDGRRGDSFENFFLDRYAAAYEAEMAHFARVLAGEQPLVTYDDGVAALELAEAAARSVAERRLVTIA
ncbi:inositol 2-dehydrogenase [Sphingobium sp.]|uniref:inositol 2-dehydrogenase n=1 Tax=Sphingobium sp. TaxID=1912891 RepID=UPI0028BDC83B|nr:inositol 2-dehydrogenase [Sphingobium sp.]